MTNKHVWSQPQLNNYGSVERITEQTKPTFNVVLTGKKGGTGDALVNTNSASSSAGTSAKTGSIINVKSVTKY
jgi:hypothetical protein